MGKGPRGHSDRLARGPLCPLLQALPSVISGGVCLEPENCPCEWGGSFFPPGTALQEDCGNW